VGSTVLVAVAVGEGRGWRAVLQTRTFFRCPCIRLTTVWQERARVAARPRGAVRQMPLAARATVTTRISVTARAMLPFTLQRTRPGAKPLSRTGYDECETSRIPRRLATSVIVREVSPALHPEAQDDSAVSYCALLVTGRVPSRCHVRVLPRRACCRPG
jgi:hypothetical protein